MKGLLKKTFSGSFRGKVKFIEPMKYHTSLRIGGPADVFAIPYDLTSLRNILNISQSMDVPFVPIGSGTNILVKDGGVEGVVISVESFRKIEVLEEDDKYVYIFAEAGTPLQRLVKFSRENGYSGIEGLAGIPGSVGGAICGNAGAFGYEMKDVVVSVSIMDFEGRIDTLSTGEIRFGYRSSSILSNGVLFATKIRLMKDKKEDVSQRIEGFLRKRQKSQPISERSAGCVFKNPPGLCAGKLIDEAGCKGMRIGDVEVSNIHANFFINKGSATASDFIRLMDAVRSRVLKTFGVELETEIRIIGRG